MIKYNLICECEKTFESWFSSGEEYEKLFKKKLINCIYCKSNSIKKTVMSPRLASKSNKNLKDFKLNRDIKNQLIEFRKYIEKNCKDVGDNFPQEVRSIFYDKKKSKGVYGIATPEETTELLEEGIDIATIPWVDKKEN